MTSAEVRAIVEAEVGGNWLQSNAHAVDLRKCLVQPRKIACRNTFPKLDGGKATYLSDTKDGLLIAAAIAFAILCVFQAARTKGD